MARAYEATGQPEQALATLDRIDRPLSAHPQLDEVQFRRGELLFSAKQYPQAPGRVCGGDQARHRLGVLEPSLYKHGWSLFKQSLNEESLPSFAGVLDQQLLGGKLQGPLQAPGAADPRQSRAGR